MLLCKASFLRKSTSLWPIKSTTTIVAQSLYTLRFTLFGLKKQEVCKFYHSDGVSNQHGWKMASPLQLILLLMNSCKD